MQDWPTRPAEQPGYLIVTTTCLHLDERTRVTELTLPVELYNRWRHDAVTAQEAFAPLNLSDDDLERLISGTCPTCWAQMSEDCENATGMSLSESEATELDAIDFDDRGGEDR
jgi:hypothetical protein